MSRGHPQPQPSRAPSGYALHPHAAHREVGGEVFIVTGQRGVHRLAAPTAVELFRLVVQGGATVEAMVAHLTAHYDVTAAQAHADVQAFVTTLTARDIAVERPLEQA